jgi:hypothetical protein
MTPIVAQALLVRAACFLGSCVLAFECISCAIPALVTG